MKSLGKVNIRSPDLISFFFFGVSFNDANAAQMVDIRGEALQNRLFFGFHLPIFFKAQGSITGSTTVSPPYPILSPAVIKVTSVHSPPLRHPSQAEG
jgi:hypothetical protein